MLIQQKIKESLRGAVTLLIISFLSYFASRAIGGGNPTPSIKWFIGYVLIIPMVILPIPAVFFILDALMQFHVLRQIQKYCREHRLSLLRTKSFPRCWRADYKELSGLTYTAEWGLAQKSFIRVKRLGRNDS
jgi:hypothetical protein